MLLPVSGEPSVARGLLQANSFLLLRVTVALFPVPTKLGFFVAGVAAACVSFLHFHFGWHFVEQSNNICDFVAACYELCCKLGKLFVCENPKDSLFWKVTPWCERQYQEMGYLSRDVTGALVLRPALSMALR